MEKANDQATNNGVTQQEVNGDPQDDVDLDEDAQATERLTDSDPNKVKFTAVKMDGYGLDKNGDARVDIRVVQASVGMGKDELMKYANEPYWVRLRMILFVLFWVSWVAMLVGAVAIIMLAPRCPPAPRLEWHQKNAMYRVMVKSFKDSDNDGTGDLQGVISKLDYFKDLNVGTILLSAFYEMAPNSDGIVNHTSIDKQFGTMTDFDDLLKEMGTKDLRLVLDFNPNHSSDQHPWFQASIKEEEPYTDFYVWAKGADEGKPPSNWLNVNSEPAWEWNEERQKYYLNTFGKDKPDLNLRNPLVREELEQILRFWLDKGVHGFKVIAASNLVEDGDLRDEPLQTPKKTPNPKYADISHSYTVGHPENLVLFEEWREILNNYTTSYDAHRILIAEVSESVNSSMHYYGNASHPLADFPINTQLTRVTENVTGSDILGLIKEWLVGMPEKVWPNWELGSEHVDRLATRVGSDLVDAMHMIVTMAKGTPILYYGDELGIKYEPLQGHEAELNQSPMQWNSEPQAGFSNGTDPVIPLNTDYQKVNVEAQDVAGEPSHLSIFKTLMDKRKLPAIGLGSQEFPVVNDNIFSLLRVQKGSPGYLLVVNLGMNTTETDFTGKSDYLPENGRVEVRSLNLKKGPLAAGDHPKVGLNSISLGSKQAVIFSFVPVFKE